MPTAINPLHGHRAIRENLCHDCGGTLRDGSGTFSERPVVDGAAHYAAAICNNCKAALRSARSGLCLHTVSDQVGRIECYLEKRHRGGHRYQEVEE